LGWVELSWLDSANMDCKNLSVMAMPLNHRNMCLYGTSGLVAHAACAQEEHAGGKAAKRNELLRKVCSKIANSH